MESKPERARRPHELQIEARKKAVLTGVDEVVTMTETAAQVLTSAGALRIEGKDMHIARFNADEGALVIDGNFYGFRYADGVAAKGFFKRLLK